MDERKINIVTVRWWDGYKEDFRATEIRFGSDLLWMRLEDGNNRHIPLRMVRWFGTSIESHQNTGMYIILRGLIMRKVEDKLTYSDLREEIHRILTDFLDYESTMQNNGEFDFEYMEYRTDEILRLIKRQGGTV